MTDVIALLNFLIRITDDASDLSDALNAAGFTQERLVEIKKNLQDKDPKA